MKATTLAEAIRLVPDGATVALGGSLFRRHPMAAVFELVRQGRRDLALLGWNNTIDMDVLIGAGLVREVHTSYVGMGGFGLARNFRRAAEAGRLRVYEHSETSALDSFRAGSMGLDFFPSKSPLGTDILGTNPDVTEIASPFTGEPYAALRAFRPDVAIVHMHMADEQGNVQLDPRRATDNEADLFIAKSAKTVIVTVEQLVSREQILGNPAQTVLPRLFVSAVVEAPFGAHPTSCDCRYDADLEFLAEYHAATEREAAFGRWLDRWVRGPADHGGYLEQAGVKRLLALECPREG